MTWEIGYNFLNHFRREKKRGGKSGKQKVNKEGTSIVEASPKDV